MGVRPGWHWQRGSFQPDYASCSGYCEADWYRFAKGGAFLMAVLCAALLSGVVAYRVAPARKGTVSTACISLAIAASALGVYFNL